MARNSSATTQLNSSQSERRTTPCQLSSQAEADGCCARVSRYNDYAARHDAIVYRVEAAEELSHRAAAHRW